MSHYAVMTIVRKGSEKDVDDLLAPYDENLEVAPYVRHTKAELIADMRERLLRLKRSRALAEELGEEKYHAKVNNDDPKRELIANFQYLFRKESDALIKIDVENDDALFEAVKDEYGDGLNEAGDYVSTYNPNSKWDWYQIGGRWGGSLILKEKYGDGSAHTADEAKAKDIDWDAMYSVDPEEAKRLSDFWDDYVEGGKAEKECQEIYGFMIYRKEYFREHYGSKEEYVRRHGIWTTYAVLDDKGWHAPGEMGWFGCSDETDEAAKSWDDSFRARFVDTLDPEDYVVIVDCHI